MHKTDAVINVIKLKTQTNPHYNGNLILFYKEAINTHWKKRHDLQQMVLVKFEVCLKRRHVVPYLTPCTKFKSKEIKNCSIKSHTLNLITKEMVNNLDHTVTGKNFLKGMIMQAQ